jgi:alpha-amylase
MKTYRRILFLLLVLVLAGCSRISPAGEPPGTSEPQWWNDRVFYQIFVRSFYDSDGDGIGDFNGIIEKLDYLNDGDPNSQGDLGVTGLWLLPIHPSPSYHGYDVLDYYDVNPDYGSMEDFQRLLAEADARGIRVVIDLVLNHTSEQHPWFRESRNHESPYRDWYVWEDENPGFIGPWGQEVWHRTPNGYYYGIFWGGMPDLNYRNPEVSEKMMDVARFWLEEVGVDGFRIDGAQHLIEEGRDQRHTEPTHEWFRNFRLFYKEINPQAVTIGEVWDTNFAVARYSQGDQFDLAFNFDLAEAMLASANTGNARVVQEAMQFTQRLLPIDRWAGFLANHDMDRTMSQLRQEEGKVRVAATMLLTLPGVPYIYYGEEIGMVGQKPDEYIRTPMQWSSADQAGFSTGRPWLRLNPDYPSVNVQLQQGNPDSLLSHYQTLIELRSSREALRTGEYYLVISDQRSVYTFLRFTEVEAILVIINLGSTAVSEYSLSSEKGPLSGTYQAALLYSDAGIGEAALPQLSSGESGGFELYQPLPVLPPFSSTIIQLRSP